MKFITDIRGILFFALISVNCSNVFSATALENGYSALESNQTKKAIQYFQIALKENPDSVEAKLGLASSYYRKRIIEQTENLIDQVLQTEPSNVEAIFLKAKIEYRKNNLEYAKTLLVKVVDKQPDNIEANMTLANVLNALGETALADDIYEKFKN